MSDHDIPPLDDDVRALVRRAATVDPAPAEAKARVLERVIHVVGTPGGGGGDGGAAGPRGTHGSGPGAAMRFVRRLPPLAASFALGAGVVAVAMHGAPEARRFMAPPVVSVDRPAADPVAERSGDGKNLDASSQARASTPPAAIAPTASRPPPSSPSRDQLTAERQLLDLARGALEREEPQAALDATARHERGYPNGALAQEREAIAIRALVLLGRTTEARARADRFRSRFPQSLLLPTIESTVGAGRMP